jgi:hypothetical protein
VSTQPQLCPRLGRALAAILAVAASISILVAQDHPLANSDAGTASTVESAGSGTTSAANGTLSGNAAPLPEEMDISQLQRFLSVSPERLEQMRKTIEYLEKMPPGELIALRQRVHSIQELTQEIRADIRLLPTVEDRSILNRYVYTLYPEDIQPLLKSFQDAKDKPAVRQQIIQDMLKKAVANGIKPDPNASDRGAMPGGPRGNRGRNPNNNAGADQHSGPPPPAAIPPPSP